MKLITHSWYMAVRDIRNLLRQPWYVALTLVQPILYILLFAELFKKIVEIPGFGSSSYIAFLTPGIVVMTALFSGGWSGMSMVQDLERGFTDRILVTPVSRTAIITGRLVQMALVIAVQALIVMGIAFLRGATVSNGVVSLAIVMASAILLSVAFAALSNGLALLVRQEESVIGAVQFVVLPLTFLSSVFMAQNLMPGWMQSVAKFNPLNWAVAAGRAASESGTDWDYVFARLGWLVALCAVCTWLATRAFRTYQRSI